MQRVRSHSTNASQPTEQAALSCTSAARTTHINTGALEGIDTKGRQLCSTDSQHRAHEAAARQAVSQTMYHGGSTGTHVWQT